MWSSEFLAESQDNMLSKNSHSIMNHNDGCMSGKANTPWKILRTVTVHVIHVEFSDPEGDSHSVMNLAYNNMQLHE